MLNILKIALRNLARFARRTLLTSTLVTLGVVGVMLFIAISGSFKSMMIGQFTDGVLGHLQVHRRGYVASIESLPINLNMPSQGVSRVEQALAKIDGIEAYSKRLKLNAMFSNFTETTSARVNGIEPEKEVAAMPLLAGRVTEGNKEAPLLKQGEVIIPMLLARGLNVKVGDEIVLVATNREGSVNGKTFKVRGIMESMTGPSGRDTYIHIDDARTLLRLTQPEVNEIAIRLRNPAQLDAVHAQLSQELGAPMKKDGPPSPEMKKGAGSGIEVHTWASLSPFANIANMIDMLTIFIKVMLVAIVLVSVMNVMMMAVYERIREIGTISAIGTPPRKILALFLVEGSLLGLGGTLLGVAISLAAIFALNIWKISFNFGQQRGLLLAPSIGVADVLIISGMVVLIALVASLQPAWKASRMDPVRALGHV